MKKITLKQIAKHFNVSTATVSKALNNQPDISDRLKKEISDYAEEVNYRPDYFARSLKGGKTNVIGVVVADLSNPAYNQMLSGITDVMDSAGFNLMFCNSKEDEERENNHIRMLLQKGVDGLLIVPSSVKRKRKEVGWYQLVKESNTQFILMNRYLEGCEADIVMSDNRHMSYMGTKYLIDRGHKNILHFTCNLKNSTVEDRIAGFKGVLTENGLPYSAKNVYRSAIDSQACYQNIIEFLKDPQNRKFTAIYTYNDIMAFPVIRGIIDSGLRVPEDIAVMGNDNISFSEECLVSLTTVEQDTYEIGRIAANLMIEKQYNQINTVRRYILEPSGIVERKSV